ncbi:MAG: hypothetical protein ACYC7D_15380 [Nitrososphaerales archaeon]
MKGKEEKRKMIAGDEFEEVEISDVSKPKTIEEKSSLNSSSAHP